MTTNPAITTLARMAARGTLEVEHLLHAARQPSPDLADALDALATELGWRFHPCSPEVPFGTWGAVVSIYCRAGYDGLLEAAHAPDMLPYVLGVLDALKTEAALEAVIKIAANGADDVPATSERTAQIVTALNLAAMNSPQDNLDEADRAIARDFLHAALPLADGEAQWGTLLCALRYFGDETSLPLIAACPPLPPHWEAARKAAVRAIRKTAKRPASLR